MTERDRKFSEGTRGEGCASKDVCTKSKREPGGIMYCYRGVWYNPKDLIKKQAKPQKTERVYRGTKHAA